MTDVLPGWYEPAFVNVENLLIDLFAYQLPAVECGCWTPADWLEGDTQPDPQLWFMRVPGGRVDYERGYDEALMQAMAVTPSRDDSWRLVSFVRSTLLPLQGSKVTMSEGYTAQIHGVEEVAGPQLVTPGQQIDTRIVAATFKVRVGLRSRKRYTERLRSA